MKFLKENWSFILTMIFLIVVGILILADPATFGLIVIKVAGGVLALLGIYDIIKYFRAKPEEAAQGQNFASGTLMITLGCFCIFGTKWFVDTFPVLAVLYGLFQVLIGFRKLQYTVDALRLKLSLWYLLAISACVSMIFGFIIVCNPELAFMAIWVFTGITMIIEGILDAVILVMQFKLTKHANSCTPAHSNVENIQ